MGKISISNLSKNYKNFRFGPVDIEVSGKIIGIVGPNGAGKSTFLSLISRIRQQDSGEVYVNDKKNYTVALVPEEGGAPKQFTIESFVDIISEIYGCNKEDMIAKVINEVQKDKKTKFSKLSKGLFRRVILTTMLNVAADIYILDEPFSGLDVESRYVWKKKLKTMADNGKFIVLSSHDMFDVEEIVDTVIFVYDGQIVTYGTIEKLKKETGCDTLECSFMKFVQFKKYHR